MPARRRSTARSNSGLPLRQARSSSASSRLRLCRGGEVGWSGTFMDYLPFGWYGLDSFLISIRAISDGSCTPRVRNVHRRTRPTPELRTGTRVVFPTQKTDCRAFVQSAVIVAVERSPVDSARPLRVRNIHVLWVLYRKKYGWTATRPDGYDLDLISNNSTRALARQT